MLVVLLVDPVAGGEVRRAQEGEEDGAGIHAPLRQAFGRRLRHAGRGRLADPDRWAGDAVVDDGVGGQGRRGDPGDLAGGWHGPTCLVEPTLHDRDGAVIGDPADDRDRQAPALAGLADGVVAVRSDHGDHPLL